MRYKVIMQKLHGYALYLIRYTQIKIPVVSLLSKGSRT